MNSLIVYSSNTGNTKKLAQAVYDSLTGSKELYPITEAPDPAGYDFVALGFWLVTLTVTTEPLVLVASN